MVKIIDSESTFSQALDSAKSSGKLVVVDFFAEWCGPCKVLAPKLEDLSQKHPNIEFLKVDVDNLEGLARQYNITAMPTLILIKGGQQVAQVVGANLPALLKEIEKHSAQPATAAA